MDASMTTAQLTLQNVSKHFTFDGGEYEALKKVSVDIYRREFVAVVGASGCGKSTLIRIVAGLEQASSGQVLVNAREVSGPGADRGMVFQQFTLFPWLSVKQNIMFGLRSQDHARSTCEQIANQWIELIGLKRFENHFPRQLSGGMQQRVAIARALAPSPNVLLMDEPFAALDPHTRKRMQGYLLKIWQNMDLTVMFVTHDLEEAVLLADRVLVMAPNPGRLLGSVEITIPREECGRDRYDLRFKEAMDELQALSHASATDDDPPLELFRLTKV